MPAPRISHSRLRPSVSERRESPRAVLSVPALYDADFTYGRAQCRDVSTGGLALDMRQPVPVGTRLSIYIELPTGHAVEEKAEVVRCSPGEVALRFIAPTLQARAVVRAFVHQQVSDPAQAAAG